MIKEIKIPSIVDADKQIRANLNLIEKDVFYNKLEYLIRFYLLEAINTNHTEFRIAMTPIYNYLKHEIILNSIFDAIAQEGYVYERTLRSREIGEGDRENTFYYTVKLLINDKFISDNIYFKFIGHYMLKDDFNPETEKYKDNEYR